ncbi:MAG: GDP-mannose 4,6-dehydratase [Micromonosporaceae bacterium]|nr:GDP-mannose 4,6-dehydratase [Micromonosporaceae bacterium]
MSDRALHGGNGYRTPPIQRSCRDRVGGCDRVRMRVLVTGGAGFIGSHLVPRLLAEGMRVAVADDLSAGTWDGLGSALQHGLSPDEIFIADIRSPAGAAVIERWRPEVVVHLAAQSRVTVSVREPQHDAVTNIGGTVNLLDAAVRAGVRQFVAASSGGTVYGEMPEGLDRLAETAVRDPVSPYGVGKAAADSYLHAFQRLYGLSTATLLLGNVYGPRLDHAPGQDVIASFIDAVSHGRPPVVCGDGTQTRDFVHVADVVDAFTRACHRGITGALNIGTGVETSIVKVARLVCATLAAPIEIDHAPARVGEVRRVCLDSSRAHALLGWRARITLADGITALAAPQRPGKVVTVGARQASNARPDPTLGGPLDSDDHGEDH